MKTINAPAICLFINCLYDGKYELMQFMGTCRVNLLTSLRSIANEYHSSPRLRPVDDPTTQPWANDTSFKSQI